MNTVEPNLWTADTTNIIPSVFDKSQLVDFWYCWLISNCNRIYQNFLGFHFFVDSVTDVIICDGTVFADLL